MLIKEFIANLEKSNFSLVVENGKLILKGDKKKLTKEAILAIKTNQEVISYINKHKDELIEYISAAPDVHSEKRSRNISAIYGLSGLQQGMLFHSLYDKRVGAYIEQFACDLVEPNIKLFAESWQNVMMRHSILRSAFYYDEFKVPVQCVYREVELPLEIVDYRDIPANEQQAVVDHYEEADRNKGFEFKAPPLMRITLIRVSDNRYRMLWTSHHILFDGWSTQILMEEFLRIYEMLMNGTALPPIEEDRFEEYIRYIEGRDKEQSQLYWRNYLKSVEQNTLLPFIRSSAERTKGLGTYKKVSMHIDARRTALIEGFARRQHITINTIMQGVWAYLLHRYTGNNDVVYGVVVSGRPEGLPGVERRVGMYINTLPLHSRIDREHSISDWLQGIQKDQFASRKHEHTALYEIQRWSGVQGDMFDTLLVFENYPVSKVIGAKKWALQVENAVMSEQTNYPLTITIGSAEYINIGFNYNTSQIDEAYMQQIISQFEHALMQVVEKGDGTIGDIELLTDAQKQLVTTAFNNTTTGYPDHETIVDLFEHQVHRTPNAVALVFDDQQLTYGELNSRANQLARYLQRKGVNAGTLVPVCVERNPAMIVALIAILKAGAAYIPIDPEYPADRIAFMIDDTSAPIVISSRRARTKLLQRNGVQIIELDTHWIEIEKEPVDNLQTTILPSNLAYVIYTSGSTGKPKGVMIEHHNVHTFICWSREEFAASKFDIVYASTSICFDLSVFEIFFPLSIGKPVRIVENGLNLGLVLGKDPNVLINTVPVVMEHLIKEGADLSSVTVINMAGEPIPMQVHQALDPDKMEIRNLYGPTEDTTYSTVYRLRKGEPILIGKPISNTFIFITDTKGELVPPGVPGEICIGGDGLARGYLNRDELTAEKFVSNPFSIRKGRLYKTGDLGRWRPDGNMEYLGRLDAQVKIRGYRIELGEIETALQQSGMVKQNVVLARPDKLGQKRLVAYVVPAESYRKESTVQYLTGKLPAFMIPALWVELEMLPLTPNGKIDRKALPDPDASELLNNEYLAPRNELETRLVAIWKELLQTERVGVRDNFFELGGHSLLVLRLLSSIRKELKVEVAVGTFFELVTIEQLANYIKVNQQSFKPKIENYDTIKL